MKTLKYIFLSVFFFAASVSAEKVVRFKSEVRINRGFLLLKDILLNPSDVPQVDQDLIILEVPKRGIRRVQARTLAINMGQYKSLRSLDILSPPMVKVVRGADLKFVDTVREELRQQLMESDQWASYKIKLKFTPEDTNVISDLSLADKIILDAHSAAADLSSVKVTVSFVKGKKSLGTLNLKPLVMRELEMLTLLNSVRKGDIIVKSDLKLSKIWSLGKEEGFCMDFDDAVGFEVRRNMLEGRTIPVNYLAEPVYAAKGEIIHVEYSFGTLNLSIQGKALQQGRRGDSIRVMNSNSGKVIVAKLVSNRLARVK